jgi:hypothetical protein
VRFAGVEGVVAVYPAGLRARGIAAVDGVGFAVLGEEPVIAVSAQQGVVTVVPLQIVEADPSFDLVTLGIPIETGFFSDRLVPVVAGLAVDVVVTGPTVDGVTVVFPVEEVAGAIAPDVVMAFLGGNFVGIFPTSYPVPFAGPLAIAVFVGTSNRRSRRGAACQAIRDVERSAAKTRLRITFAVFITEPPGLELP